MSKSASLPKVASQFILSLFFSPWWEWDSLLGVSQQDRSFGVRKWEEEEEEEAAQSREDVISVCDSPTHIVLQLQGQPIAASLLC